MRPTAGTAEIDSRTLDWGAISNSNRAPFGPSFVGAGSKASASFRATPSIPSYRIVTDRSETSGAMNFPRGAVRPRTWKMSRKSALNANSIRVVRGTTP
jgi:hypothetical protein